MDTRRETLPHSTEHTLVCLSSSPSNERIVRTAAGMAKAFGGGFTALYVQTPDYGSMSPGDRARLQESIGLAESLGAEVVTVYGEDVSYQIAEYARLSAVTMIVIGSSRLKRRRLWERPSLTERLIELAPAVDIHVIPDSAAALPYRRKRKGLGRHLALRPRDLALTAAILAAATLLGILFRALGFTEANMIAVYIPAVLLIAIFTQGYACSSIGALLSVCLFNFFLTEPRHSFRAYGTGYPVTFLVMLAAAIITATLASKLKEQARRAAQAELRTKLLFDTDQRLQKAQDEDQIRDITARQLTKLLERDLIFYQVQDGGLGESRTYGRGGGELFSQPLEREAAAWALEQGKRSGAGTDRLPQAQGLYLAIRMNSQVYGVAGIDLGGRPLEPFENSLLLSILGECALAIENDRNAREKEQAMLRARQEQLRADLLRSISHDLRTPLTSISGNASNLLSNFDSLDPETRKQMFTDIYEDSQWLTGLVENLLSVTRIEQGRMELELSLQLMDEVIDEALAHIDRRRCRQQIRAVCQDELLLARMDARLIVQVIVNLVDNAIKYTPPGSHIEVRGERQPGFVAVSVIDDGPGIAPELKSRVFEMFFTGGSRVADSRRSLGLGLYLCRTIVRAHGGELSLSDNRPHGAVFTFTIPSGEVSLNE